MPIAGYIRRMLERQRPSSTYPCVAVSDDHTFYLEDTKKTAYLGAFFVGLPMVGADAQTVERLRSVMSAGYPPGTYIQLSILSAPDIDHQLSTWYLRKVNALDESTILSDEQKAHLLDLHYRNKEASHLPK